MQLQSLKNEYEIQALKNKRINNELADKEVIKYEIMIKQIDSCLSALDRFEYELENLDMLNLVK